MSQIPPSRDPHDDPYARSPIYRYLALAAALLAWGFDGMEQGIYGIMTRTALKDLIPDVATQMAQGGKIDAIIGPYFSISMAMWLWGAACGGVIFGRLGDRHGRVRSLIFAVITYTTFTGLSALSTHWTQFIGCRFLGALGLGGTWPLCVALAVETWPDRSRTVIAGLIGAASNVGFLIAATYSRYMLSHDATWRWVIGMGFFIGLLSLPIIFLVPEPTQWKRSRARREHSSLSDLFRGPYLRATIVGSLLSTVALLGTWGAFLWFPTYVDKLAEGTARAGDAKAIVSQWQAYGQVIGGFLGGMLAGWLGNKRAWVILCITAWASVTAMFGLTHEFSFQLVGLGTIAGFFVTGFFGWLPKFLPELYPTRIRATGQGFAYNIGRVLTGAGVLVAGGLVNLFHGDYRPAAMTIASVYLLGLVIIAFAPDTRGRMVSDEEDQAPASH